MLSILDTRGSRNCDGFTRRQWLQVGALGGLASLGGLTLPGLLATQAQAASANKFIRDKAVVLLFLQGGPSHIELFDPKMTAPAEIRSTTGETPTKLPGITFGGGFKQLAARTDRISVVRSYASQNGDHSYQSVTSNNKLKASLSSMYARVVGANNATTGMPTNCLVLPEAVSPGLKLKGNFETGALPTLTQPGELGPSFAAFNPSGGGDVQKNMELRIARERFDDRRYLLGKLDTIRREVDSSGMLGGSDKFQQQAFEVIARGVAEAFDLSKEDPRTIAKYDTSKLFRMEELQRYNDLYRSSNLLGKQMLLARRLVEAGCGFVTVSDCGWDMHGNGNTLPKLTAIEPLGAQVDHAVAAFIDDLAERGLTDKVLLVVTGEMGRTPRINGSGGRDHYASLTPLLFAGGSLPMGQVIGQSDRNASRPATDEYNPSHLVSTIMHTLFDIGQFRLARELPGDVARVITSGEPIRELV